MTFEIVFRYISIHCEKDSSVHFYTGRHVVNFLWSSNIGFRLLWVPTDWFSKSLRHAMDLGRTGRTFCFDVIISATIFARRKSAGGNMIGLNQQRKTHASSRSFGGWVGAHFPEQRLVIEPTKGTTLCFQNIRVFCFTFCLASKK